jgi:opine dehydrogenase
MSKIAVLGAGAGGAAAAVDLAQRGHRVALWNRSPGTLEPFRAAGGVGYEGALGSGVVELDAITTSMAEAVAGARAALVCLPSLGHEQVADQLATVGCELPLVLDPGHTGGALHLAARIAAAGATVPPIAELSTLTYVTRKAADDRVRIISRADEVHVACLPGGEAALEVARELFPGTRVERDVIATGLANVNLVLHPPGALLGAAWVEATGGDYTFYAEGTTPGVARVIAALDAERLAVAAAYGHDLPALADEMAAVGTADRDAAARGDLRAAIAGGVANSTIRAPDSLGHRYYTEDFGFGVVPFITLAEIAGVEVPLARGLVTVAGALCGRDFMAEGLTAERLGIAGLDRDALLGHVRGGVPRAIGAGRR